MNMLPDTKPLVSVIICTYNRSTLLNETLKSITQQTYSPYEVIVVDNNSTDDTVEVVRQYPAVRYLQELRQGVAYARNTGLAASRGEYVGFIDDDETVVPEWIESIIQCFELEERVAAATGPLNAVFMGTPSRWIPNPNDFIGSYRGDQIKILRFGETIVTGNAMFRRSLINGMCFDTKLGRVGKNLVSGEDTDFIIQLYNRGYLVAYSPQAVVHHYAPAERITLKWFTNRLFCEGITEYMLKGNSVLYRRALKPFINLFVLMISGFSCNPKFVAKRWLKLCQTMGTIYGPIYSFRNHKS